MERLLVLEAADRFVTLSEDGYARVWTVGPDGIPSPNSLHETASHD